MTGEFQAVLDACVLVQAALRDTLLRLAEKRLYLPRWSDEIIHETVSTLQTKLGKPREKTDYLVGELTEYFADAWVEGYEGLTASMDNDPGDRHVLAAAVRCGAEAIVTFNLRHFPQASLERWGIDVQSPDEFLINLYHLNPEVVIHTLHEQSADIGWELGRLLAGGLHDAAPKFSNLIAGVLGIRRSG